MSHIQKTRFQQANLGIIVKADYTQVECELSSVNWRFKRHFIPFWDEIKTLITLRLVS